MKRIIASFLFVLLFAVTATAHAVPNEINAGIMKEYAPAIWNRGLETAYVNPDESKYRGFVVVEKGGVPVERARFYITWADYDYRGVVIHLDDENKVTTRRGRPYAYLQRGDVMAIAGVKYFNNTIYLKLISPEVYVPQNRLRDKRHSRVTVMLGFKFPKKVIKGDDATAVLSTLGGWLKPFANLGEAKAYASGIRDETTYVAAEKAGKPVGTVVPVAVGTADEDEKMKSLEEKIDRARRDLEEAEEELEEIKKTK